jgi:hypothetical protein
VVCGYIKQQRKAGLMHSVKGTSDFDAQMSGIKFCKSDENLKTVLQNIEWLLEFSTF